MTQSLGSSPYAVNVFGVYSAVPPTPAAGQPCAIQLDSQGNLLVTIAGGGGGGGVQYSDGTTQATPTGTVALGKNPSNVLHALAIDANGNLNVNIQAGGGTGGGPADVGLSTAASETDAARQKVTSALRLWDQSQAAGSQLVGWRGDTTSGAWVNVKSIGTVTVSFSAPQHVIVDSATLGTVTVSGTVTANQGTASAGAKWSVSVDNTPTVTVGNASLSVTQGTNPWITQDNSDAASGAALPSVFAVNAGSDYGGTPHVQALKVDASGNIYIGNASLTVAFGSAQHVIVDSGTVTANQGGAPWSVTFPSAQHVIIDSATLGTVTVSGTVTANQGGAPWQENITQIAGASLGATAVVNFGTAPAAAAVPGVNASLFSGTTGLTNTGSALDVNLKTSSITLNVQFPSAQHVIVDSGTVTANQGGAPWSVTFPSAQHVIIDSATLGTVTVSGTVTANQGGAPWQENITQFGNNPVVTGIGVSGAGIPRVTVSSDSFPAVQPISGTVTDIQGTSPWIVQEAVNGGSIDYLQLMILELRALKAAVLSMHYAPTVVDDFSASNFQDQYVASG